MLKRKSIRELFLSVIFRLVSPSFRVSQHGITRPFPSVRLSRPQSRRDVSRASTKRPQRGNKKSSKREKRCLTEYIYECCLIDTRKGIYLFLRRQKITSVLFYPVFSSHSVSIGRERTHKKEIEIESPLVSFSRSAETEGKDE